MIINKELKKFLEIIYNKNMNLESILECELRKSFKNNQFYNLRNFCIDNELIIIEYHKINLTKRGNNLFNILKECKNI